MLGDNRDTKVLEFSWMKLRLVPCTMLINICIAPTVILGKLYMQLQNQTHFYEDYTCKIVQLCNNTFIYINLPY